MNKVISFLIFVSIVISTKASEVTSPFNQLRLGKADNSFSFLVTGHLYGASTNVSGFPASTILASIDSLNRTNADFLISLGDLFMDVDSYHLDNYRKSFFEKINFPLFNAVGNHDLSGNKYSKYFGKTYYAFVHGSAFFIFLDTEESDGRIKGKQLEFFKDVLSKAASLNEVKSIFISTHRPVWAENNPRYTRFFRDNTRTFPGTNNFEEEIFPILREYTTKNIFWLSGSLGDAPASIFYDQPFSNITYINTAIRSQKRDAVVKVEVYEGGDIKFSAISLTGQQMLPVESYDISFWEANTNAVTEFNFRLLPYLIIKTLRNHNFYYGLAVGFLLVFSGFVFVRKKQNQ
jgi:hypothetical protein